MAWSIAEVARMSKVTSRTLRHYDDVGLLAPAYVGRNGYRYDEQEQLLRLQQVLLLRGLGLGLGAITEVQAGDRDQVAVLRQHERWLHSERGRLGQLADTVSRTIRQLQGEDQMTAPELFEGFADRQAQLEDDLVTEHGEGVREHFRSALEDDQGLDAAGLPRRPAPGRGARRQGPRGDAVRSRPRLGHRAGGLDSPNPTITRRPAAEPDSARAAPWTEPGGRLHRAATPPGEQRPQVSPGGTSSLGRDRGN